MRLFSLLLISLTIGTAHAQTSYEIFLSGSGVSPLSEASLTQAFFSGGALPGLVVSGRLGAGSPVTRIYTASGETAVVSPNGQVSHRLSFATQPVALSQAGLGDVLAARLTGGPGADLLIVGAQNSTPPTTASGLLYANDTGSLRPGPSLPSVYNAKLASTGDLVVASGTNGNTRLLDVMRYVPRLDDATPARLDLVTRLPGVELAAVAFATDASGTDVLVVSGIGENGGPTGRAYVRRAGDTGFSEVANAGVPGTFGGAATLNDLDGDGLLDLLVTGSVIGPQFVEGTTALLMGNADGTFRPSGLTLPQLAGSVADAADRDGDGDLDLLVAGLDGSPIEGLGSYYVYDNDGSGAFTLYATGAAPYGGDGAWMDLNGFGELDFVIVGTTFGAADIRFYRGVGGGEN